MDSRSFRLKYCWGKFKLWGIIAIKTQFLYFDLIKSLKRSKVYDNKVQVCVIFSESIMSFSSYVTKDLIIFLKVLTVIIWKIYYDLTLSIIPVVKPIQKQEKYIFTHRVTSNQLDKRRHYSVLLVSFSWPSFITKYSWQNTAGGNSAWWCDQEFVV